jgi:hypothetical protein
LPDGWLRNVVSGLRGNRDLLMGEPSVSEAA